MGDAEAVAWMGWKKGMTEAEDIFKEDTIYAKAVATVGEITYGIWPWVSKRRAWKECKRALAEYRDSLLKRGYEKRDNESKDKELHTYNVTVGYENFPWYFEIQQKGDWFLFCDGSKVMTVRHKDEKLDHTIYYRDRIVKAKDNYEAIKMIEYNSKYHICSFEVEELSTDG